MLRSMWLSKGRGENNALRWVRDKDGSVRCRVIEKTLADG